MDYGEYEGLTSTEIHHGNPAWNVFDDGSPHGESVASGHFPRDGPRREAIRKAGERPLIFSSGHFLRAARCALARPRGGGGAVVRLGNGVNQHPGIRAFAKIRSNHYMERDSTWHLMCRGKRPVHIVAHRAIQRTSIAFKVVGFG